MMNIVAHNLLAMNANRQFGVTDKKRAKSTEKLSSGYKINRAADDAAGLSISEKMRRQIRGLSKATENIQDGISLCQVADGALNETLDILQRMNELSVKAANGTNNVEDREAIQQEIDQLSAEVDCIANTTCFNDAIFPLRGDTVAVTEDGGTIVGGGSVDNDDLSNWNLPKELYSRTMNITAKPNATIAIDGVAHTGPYTTSIQAIGFKTERSGKTVYNFFIDGRSNGGGPNGAHWVDDETEIPGIVVMYSPGSKSEYWSTRLSDLKVENDTGYVYYNTKDTGEKLYFYKEMRGSMLWFGWNTDKTKQPVDIHGSLDYLKATRKTGSSVGGSGSKPDTGAQLPITIYQNNQSVWIQTGNEPHIGVEISLVDATCRGIGIHGLDVVKQGGADQAIEKIKSAITTADSYRSSFGAMQNRLEHAYNINMNVVENTTDAESRIRDTDVAKEMLTFSNENILAQAGQSMLSQANQSQQNILSLLS